VLIDGGITASFKGRGGAVEGAILEIRDRTVRCGWTVVTTLFLKEVFDAIHRVIKISTRGRDELLRKLVRELHAIQS